jgi:hypothetical protein
MSLNINMLGNAQGVLAFPASTLRLLQTYKYRSSHKRTKKFEKYAVVPLYAMKAYQGYWYSSAHY